MSSKLKHNFHKVSHFALFRWLRELGKWQPLTARGFLASVLGVVAIWGLAIPESDLIAYICGGAILILLALLASIGLLLVIRMRRSLTIDVNFTKDELQLLSQRPVNAGIVIKNFRLFPFFNLLVERQFQQNGVDTTQHIVRGYNSESNTCHLIDNVTFPHRGAWNLEKVNFWLNDYFGFISFAFSRQSAITVEVAAPTIAIRPLPVIAASSRAGDQLSLALERSGDLFDIKAYDPSDGVKRILWKTFAHSGQLVVRRPEPAVIPEGEVALYLIANKSEDFVAGAVQSYLQQLWAGEIITLFGCDGFKSFEYLPSKIISTINHAVWNPESGTGADFEKFCDSLQQDNKLISQMVVFINESKYHLLQQLEVVASARNIKLTIAAVPESFKTLLSLQFNKKENPLVNTALKLIKKKPVIRHKLSVNSPLHIGTEIIQCESQEFGTVA